MYERMLDKNLEPTFDDMITYCGKAGALWIHLNTYLIEQISLQGRIRFPYGNKYGWSIKYSNKKKHICDIFAEKEACMVLIRLTNQELETIYDEVGEHAKQIIDEKYPCGDNAGWLNYRITQEDEIKDLEKIFQLKCPKRK